MATLFDHDAYESLTRFLDARERHVIIDAGANVGNVTLRLARLFPQSSIVAFEPIADTVGTLRNRTGGLANVTIVQAALGDESGTVRLNVNGCPGTSSVLPSAERSIRYHGNNLVTKRIEEAPMWALDDWAESNGIDRVDFIKADVQGYELQVLKGAEGLLRSSVSAVYSEAQMTPLYDGAALYSDIDLFLRDCGFEMYQMHEIFSNGVEQRTTCCDALWVRSSVLAAYISRLQTQQHQSRAA